MIGNRCLKWVAVVVLFADPAFAVGQLGNPAPPLHIDEWVNGDPVDIAAGKGDTIFVVTFFSIESERARVRAFRFIAIQRAFESRGVRVVGIADGTREEVDIFVEEMGDEMNFPVGIDRERSALRDFAAASGGLEGYLYVYFVDKTGAIVWHGHPTNPLERILEQVVEGNAEAILEAAEKERERIRLDSQSFPLNDYFSSYESLNADQIVQTFGPHIPEDAEYVTPRIREALLASLLLYYRTYLEEDLDEPLTEFTRIVNPRRLEMSRKITRRELFKKLAVKDPVSPVERIAFPEVPLVVTKGFSEADFRGSWSDGSMGRFLPYVTENVAKIPQIDTLTTIFAMSRNLYLREDGTYRLGTNFWYYNGTLEKFVSLSTSTFIVRKPSEDILPFMDEPDGAGPWRFFPGVRPEESDEIRE